MQARNAGKLDAQLLWLLTLVFLSLFCSLLHAQGASVGAGDSSAATVVPESFAGDWYTGNVSSTNFYNPNTGQWAAPSGTGMYFKFAADGSYEKGFLMQSSLYNCSMTVFAYNRGTIELTDGQVVLHPTYGRMKSSDTCVEKNNYEKPDELKPETMLWQLGTDDYGAVTLWLRHPDGKPTAFHHR